MYAWPADSDDHGVVSPLVRTSSSKTTTATATAIDANAAAAATEFWNSRASFREKLLKMIFSKVLIEDRRYLETLLTFVGEHVDLKLKSKSRSAGDVDACGISLYYMMTASFPRIVSSVDSFSHMDPAYVFYREGLSESFVALLKTIVATGTTPGTGVYVFGNLCH
jgi:serine/threonine protein kinase